MSMRTMSKYLGSVALLAVSVPVGAQSTDAADSGESEMDEVVIVGQRLQNRQSNELKRDAVSIIDTVTADDIGRQPDFNVADALKRITGVSTIPEEDEAQFVAVRGINPDLTWFTFDGGPVASSSEGDRRRVSMEFFPSSMVKGLEVIKSRTPEIDGNTIGGQVNLVTRSAFDADDTYLIGTVFAGYFAGDGAPFGIDDSSGSNDTSLRFDGAFSSTFGAEDRVGLVVALSYFDKDRDEERIIPIGFQSDGDLTDPSSNVAPGLTIWSTYNNPIERYSAVAKLEFLATDNLDLSLQSQIVHQDDFARRESELLIPIGPTVVSYDSQFSGTMDDALFILGHDQFEAENDYAGFQFNANYDNGDGLTADFRASASEGEFFQGSPDIDFQGPLVNVAYEYNSIGAPVVTFDDPAFAFDPTNFPLQRVRPFQMSDENEISEFELNIGKNRGEMGWAFYGGLKYRELSQQRSRIQDQYIYNGGVATLADFQSPTNYELLYRPGVPSLFVNRGAVFDFIDQNPGEFTFIPGSWSEAYDISEDVFAAYAAFAYEGDNYQVIGGIRYEDTSTTSVSGSESQKGSYDNVLPSILVNYDLTDDVKLRLSYAKAVGRANPADLRISVVEDPTAQILTLNGGNPDLEAREADNYDISLEYYFDGGESMASVALFRKEIDNEIFRVSRSGTWEGQQAIFNTPTNAESASLTGFEIGLVKSTMDFLPDPLSGLGFSINYTYIDANTTLLNSAGFGTDVDWVFEQPDEILNAAIFYQLGAFEGKVSYVYTSAYNAGFAGDLNFTDQFANYESLDLQFRYDLSEHFSLIAEARNLTDQPLERRTGPSQVLLNDLSEFDKSYFFGVSYIH